MSALPKTVILLTVDEAARRLGLRPCTVRKMMRQRRIDVVRPLPRTPRIPEPAVEQIINSNYSPAILGPNKAQKSVGNKGA